MAYNSTAIFAHLSSTPLKVGQTVSYQQLLGRQGNTGRLTTGDHLHVGTVPQLRTETWRLNDSVGLGSTEQQLKEFIAGGIYENGGGYKITTVYNSIGYYNTYGKWHAGYDLVATASKNVVWPWRKPGKVVKVYTDKNGANSDYGIHVLIQFDSNAANDPLIKGDEIFMGTIEFTMDTKIRSKPSLSASVVGSYKKGEKLHGGDGIRIAEGYVWVHYKSKPHGYDRWVAIAKSPWVEEV